MEIKCEINGREVTAQAAPDMALLEFLREQGCSSVKRGCETSNCGLCTVWLDGRPVLSCSVPAARAEGRRITTLEGVQEEAREFGAFLAGQGAEQCGFCSPGFIMNVLAMVRELEDPDEEEIKEYLAGNLCRCTGYMGQMRAVRAYLQERRGRSCPVKKDAGEKAAGTAACRHNADGKGERHD